MLLNSPRYLKSFLKSILSPLLIISVFLIKQDAQNIVLSSYSKEGNDNDTTTNKYGDIHYII